MGYTRSEKWDTYRVESGIYDSIVPPTWLVNPSGYTILTACGPHETSKELKLEGDERNGVLKHSLLRALEYVERRCRNHIPIFVSAFIREVPCILAETNSNAPWK